MDLDHVALASEDITPTLTTLVGELGARVLHGGASIGFRAMQVDMGMRVELLEPHQVEVNDFLARFLARHGPGTHHLTFKTTDIRAGLARLAGAGYEPVNVSLDNPWWREAFLMPKGAEGTVVQIAQSDVDMEFIQEQAAELGMGPMQWWRDPPAPAAARALLRRVVVATDDASRAMRLFSAQLGGETVASAEGWVELGWPGGGRIRLEQRSDATGIDRLECVGLDADRVIGGVTFRSVSD